MSKYVHGQAGIGRTVRVAVAGVGNCASSLIQGASLYREDPDEPGLITQQIGPFGPGSVEVVAGFDVHPKKVGRPLRAAIYAEPNCSYLPRVGRLSGPDLEREVVAGPLEDGIGESARAAFADGIEASGLIGHVIQELKDTEADVLVNFLPVGAEVASQMYAAAAVEAGVAFVNAIPVRIARDPDWRERFLDAGLPLVGDDVKSQVGATISHRALVETFSNRGVILDETYQLNVGGNMDFRNMRDEERLAEKRVSKMQSITDVANRGRGVEKAHVGPSDFVPFLGDTKIAFIRLEGRGFGGNRIQIEAKFEGLDSPNSAGVVYDAVRWAAWARDLGVCGVLPFPSAWLMKAPPAGMQDAEALDGLRAFEQALREGEEGQPPAVTHRRDPVG